MLSNKISNGFLQSILYNPNRAFRGVYLSTSFSFYVKRKIHVWNWPDSHTEPFSSDLWPWNHCFFHPPLCPCPWVHSSDSMSVPGYHKNILLLRHFLISNHGTALHSTPVASLTNTQHHTVWDSNVINQNKSLHLKHHHNKNYQKNFQCVNSA